MTQIATRVDHRTSIKVPNSPTIFEGQLVTRAGALLSSTGLLGSTANVAAGVALCNIPAVSTYTPGSACIPANVSRVQPFGTAGILALLVQDQTAYNALNVGDQFGVFAGKVVPVGTSATVAVAINAPTNYPVVLSKKIGPDSAYYITVEVN